MTLENVKNQCKYNKNVEKYLKGNINMYDVIIIGAGPARYISKFIYKKG